MYSRALRYVSRLAITEAYETLQRFPDPSGLREQFARIENLLKAFLGLDCWSTSIRIQYTVSPVTEAPVLPVGGHDRYLNLPFPHQLRSFLSVGMMFRSQYLTDRAPTKTSRDDHWSIDSSRCLLFDRGPPHRGNESCEATSRSGQMRTRRSKSGLKRNPGAVVGTYGHLNQMPTLRDGYMRKLAVSIACECGYRSRRRVWCHANTLDAQTSSKLRCQ
jgi:hypothetical protein